MHAAIAATLTIGVVCQFVQHTDDVFPLLYFTVDSAVLGAVVAGLAVVRPKLACLPALRTAAGVGVLLSAVVYATVIAPASGTGTWIQPHDDGWVRTATILLHLVAPVLITADYVWQDVTPASFGQALRAGFAWPIVYLAGLAAMVWSGVAQLPYPFLDPAGIGWLAVLGVGGALGVLIVALTGAMYLGSRRFGGATATPESA